MSETNSISYHLVEEKILVDEIRSTLKVISHLMSIPLFLVFWIVDILYVPELKWEFLALRLLIIPICFITLYLVKSISNYDQAQILASTYAVATATLINIMIYLINDPSTAYYAGLNLVATAGLSFIPLRRRYLFFTTAGIYGPYFVNLLLNFKSLENYTSVTLNLFFIVGAIVILTLIRHFNERLRLKDIESQNKLADEIISREEIIKQKTKEATRLHQLSAQFSPQVVKAIKEGKISLDENVHRSKICAIFIDIVRSTDKVTKLHERDIQLSLARFFGYLPYNFSKIRLNYR